MSLAPVFVMNATGSSLRMSVTISQNKLEKSVLLLPYFLTRALAQYVRRIEEAIKLHPNLDVKSHVFIFLKGIVILDPSLPPHCATYYSGMVTLHAPLTVQGNPM